MGIIIVLLFFLVIFAEVIPILLEVVPVLIVLFVMTLIVLLFALLSKGPLKKRDNSLSEGDCIDITFSNSAHTHHPVSRQVQRTTLPSPANHARYETEIRNEYIKSLESIIHERYPGFDPETLMEESLSARWNNRWASIDHNSEKQYDRRMRACNASMTPTNINRLEGSAIFHGESETYMATLTSCQCMDFIKRNKPCKHMYRLSFEFDVMKPPAPLSSVEDPSKLLYLKDYEMIISYLSPKSCEILNELSCHDQILVNPRDAEQLLRSRLIVKSKNKYLLLNSYSKAALVSYLQGTVRGLHSMRKEQLIEIIVREHPDIVSFLESEKIQVEVSPYAERFQSKFHNL